MMLENKSAAHAVNGSTGGRAEQVLTGLVSTPSIPKPARPVKSGPGPGGLEYARARRLAAMLTERQRRDIVRLALVIEEARRWNFDCFKCQFAQMSEGH